MKPRTAFERWRSMRDLSDAEVVAFAFEHVAAEPEHGAFRPLLGDLCNVRIESGAARNAVRRALNAVPQRCRTISQYQAAVANLG